jgi:hypothetical protein
MSALITLKIRRGTLAQWTTANPIPAAGETCWESDTNVFRIGDGATAFLSLPEIGGGASISVEAAPAPTAAGEPGQMILAAPYLYLCVASVTWLLAPFATYSL